MTAEEWLAVNLADAPPLSPEQITVLRQIFRPVIPHMKNAAPAATEAAPARDNRTTPRRSMTSASTER